jgi:type II secretory pathway pseudopilin PulG
LALLEVLIAAGLVIAIAAGASHVLAVAVRATHNARAGTVAALLASQKLEQLRSLTWTHTTTATPPISLSLSDVITDLSTDPASDAGPGLLPSPAGTLDADMGQYVDYIDGTGRNLAPGGAPPSATVFVRRWAVRPVESDPANVLVLTVLVMPRGAAPRSAEAIRLSTIVARK